MKVKRRKDEARRVKGGTESKDILRLYSKDEKREAFANEEKLASGYKKTVGTMYEKKATKSS